MATPPVFTTGAVLTAAQMNAVGLWHLNTTTFTAQTQVDFVNVFSSDFISYRILFHEYTCTAAGEMIFRLRDAGGPINTANYDMSRLESSGTAPGDTKNAFTYTASQNWTTSYIPASTTTGAGINASMDIYRPNQTAYTRFTAQTARFDNVTGTLYNVTAVGGFRLTTAMTGFSMIRAGAGTISGIISIYGYR
jgi:hypothetical protein